MNLNSVQLAGRLTRDPEIRYTASGVAIADIGIAVSRFLKNDQGETKEETDFIDVTAFGRTAETIQKHLHKGSPIYLDGRLKLDQWDDTNWCQAVKTEGGRGVHAVCWPAPNRTSCGISRQASSPGAESDSARTTTERASAR